MIVEDEQRRVMEFIRTVNRVGYHPTGPEINEWRKTPGAKPQREGDLIKPAVPGTPDRRVRRKGTGPSPLMDAIAQSQKVFTNPLFARQVEENRRMIERLNLNLFGANKSAIESALNAARFAGFGPAEYDVIPGEPGTPAEYGPDRPAEKFLAHLRRLRWIQRNNRGRYSVTLLGHALLDGDVSDEATLESSSAIVLAKDNELAYPTVIGKISDWDDVLVVDGYLTPEALKDLLDHTNATRFLINHKNRLDLRAVLSLVMKGAGPNDYGVRRELRRADFHDRYLIGDQMLYGLTGSLNGLGRSASALIFEMPETPAQAVRAEMEDIWRDADHLAFGLDAASDDDDEEVTDEEHAKMIREDEDGRFRHDGCAIRHQKRRAAENCTNKNKAAYPDGE